MTKTDLRLARIVVECYNIVLPVGTNQKYSWHSLMMH